MNKEIRTGFMELFVRELARNTYLIHDSSFESDDFFIPMITLHPKAEKMSPILHSQAAKSIPDIKGQIPESQEPEKHAESAATQIKPKISIPKNAYENENILVKELFEKNIQAFQRKAMPSIKPPEKAGAVTEKIDILGLVKLKALMDDSSIQTIECPGPGKPILVYKGGVINTTNLTLTIEEIKNIMKEISEKTRIPLISGVFKAAWENYIVTSVMSEFVGTRFILQKKQANPEPSRAPAPGNYPPSTPPSFQSRPQPFQNFVRRQ